MFTGERITGEIVLLDGWAGFGEFIYIMYFIE